MGQFDVRLKSSTDTPQLPCYASYVEASSMVRKLDLDLAIVDLANLYQICRALDRDTENAHLR